MSLISYFGGGNVPMFNVPIGNNHAHDVIVKFAFKSRLEATSRCITTVADTLQIGLECEVRTLTYQAAVREGCDGPSIAPAETKRKRPLVTVNQRSMKMGTEHG